MTPEHVSELQNILRFLRANAFEKSEAALVEEVEVLMRAAQLEKDDAERRRASASGNDDASADSSLNGEDLRSARTVSNDAFGPMSPPAVSRPSLGRFGSNVEQAHAAMALEDAFAKRKRAFRGTSRHWTILSERPPRAVLAAHGSLARTSGSRLATSRP
jgi:hypothetical protein